MRLPLFLTWVQQFVILFTTLCVVALAPCFKQRCPTLFKVFHIESPWLTTFLRDHLSYLPVALLFAGQIGFGNYCLREIPIASYHVSRSTSVLVAVLMTSVCAGSFPAPPVLWSCVCISLGFLVTSADVNYSNLCLWGYANGCVASVFGCLYLQSIKWVMRTRKCAHSTIVLHNTVHLLVLLPLVALLLPKEAPVWRDLHTIAQYLPHTADVRDLACLMLLSGLFVTVLPFCTVIAIQQVSPLTLVVAGYVKSCLQLCAGWFLLGEPRTPLAMVGVVFVFVGSALYARASMNAKVKGE
ncbi:MAG: hypothetical protein KVP17_001197 [Porospora cf. gigantea B]|uniref:uncharacterized protein n=1 Tax=Porospora cf. gigantea B TaxID=2853592 RepID=UPI003571804B|nr:MAG: hypothetical protein KVP17_001197 [Porospora cf. gigantea B]